MILAENHATLPLRHPDRFDAVWSRLEVSKRDFHKDPVGVFDSVVQGAITYSALSEPPDKPHMGYVGINVTGSRAKCWDVLLEAKRVDHIRKGVGILVLGHTSRLKPMPSRNVACAVAEFIAEALRRFGKKAVAYEETGL